MLEALIVILVVLWLFGYGVVHIGGLIHLLLAIALIVFIWRLVSGGPRRL